ncbi:MAG: hypothetical protein M1822_003063 [Bathelium mastoideum]|nr:MAG: hypothetical protein M1822_003063 [Bathelium mastoideum]
MQFAVALGLLASAAAPAAASGNFFRIPCAGRLVDERADPIISPDVVSQHVHEIAGGNAFNFSMPSYNTTQQSSCSSCPIKKDLSNYWTPKLYWQAPNGSFFDVPRLGEGLGQRAGMTVNRAQTGQEHVQAFPAGFRMLAGNPFARSNPGFGGSNGSANAINWQCLHNSYHEPATGNLPNKYCDYALRAQIFFPSCWDGHTLDPPDHSSHMSYPVGPNYDNGDCPSTHPVKLVNIFFEIDYVMNTLLDDSGNFHGRLVLAQGDPTGYGLHGDFINGWDVPYLQEKIESCNAGDDQSALPGCFGTLFTNDEQHQCTIPPMVDEDVTGELKALPGNNPVQNGPTTAANLPVKELAIPATPPAVDYTDMTAQGWSYQGCASDTGSGRALSGASQTDNNMTVSGCLDFCAGKGYSLAGIEYGTQCYCDNSIPASQAPVKGQWGGCYMPCAGNANETCGAGDALSLYKKCDGGACTNAGFELGTPVPDTDGGSTSTRKARRSHLERHRRSLRPVQIVS